MNRTEHADETPRARFHVGKGYALFEGASGGNDVHRHAAFQVAIASRGNVSIDDGTRVHAAPVLVVPPLVRHQMLPAAHLRAFFVEPHCRFADLLREECGARITALPRLRRLDEEQLVRDGAGPSRHVDARLQQVMRALAVASDAPALPQLARDAGLSPQRLRALAREQLGMPLARWRIWQRLRLAAEALQRGESLADAAVHAGFADQAHYGRQMREMFGITPASVLPLLQPAGAARRRSTPSP